MKASDCRHWSVYATKSFCAECVVLRCRLARFDFRSSRSPVRIRAGRPFPFWADAPTTPSPITAASPVTIPFVRVVHRGCRQTSSNPTGKQQTTTAATTAATSYQCGAAAARCRVFEAGSVATGTATGTVPNCSPLILLARHPVRRPARPTLGRRGRSVPVCRRCLQLLGDSGPTVRSPSA